MNKISDVLKRYGKTKLWLADKMGITPRALHYKISKGDKFSISEWYYIISILKDDKNE